MRKQFNARAFERELVDAGYMPLNEYIRRWGELDAKESEVLSSRARTIEDIIKFTSGLPIERTNTPQPKTNAGSSENNG
jgi:hypothetical protein